MEAKNFIIQLLELLDESLQLYIRLVSYMLTLKYRKLQPDIPDV